MAKRDWLGERRMLLREILLNDEFGSVRQLVDALRARGWTHSYNTISTDLKKMQVTKTFLPFGGTRLIPKDMVATLNKDEKRLDNLYQRMLQRREKLAEVLPMRPKWYPMQLQAGLEAFGMRVSLGTLQEDLRAIGAVKLGAAWRAPVSDF